MWTLHVVHDPVVYHLCDDNLYTLMYFDTVEKSLD